MKKSILLAFLVFVLGAGAYADSMPVAGSTNGSYLAGSGTNGTTVSGNTWTFEPGANQSTIVYAGGPNGTGGGTCPNGAVNSTCFNGSTTLDINLGSLT